jgi:hypothetical protein
MSLIILIISLEMPLILKLTDSQSIFVSVKHLSNEFNFDKPLNILQNHFNSLFLVLLICALNLNCLIFIQ